MLCKAPPEASQQIVVRRAAVDGARDVEQSIQFVVLNPQPPF
jgi:hypothetical protein